MIREGSLFVFAFIILLCISVYSIDDKLFELKDMFQNTKKSRNNKDPKNNFDLTKCTPCVYNSSNICLCTDELDIIYSRGGNRY